MDDPDGAGTYGHVVDMAADAGNTLWATYSTAGTVGVLQMNQAGFANPVQKDTVLPKGYGNGQIADTIGGLDVNTYLDSKGNPTTRRDVYIVDPESYRVQRFNEGLGFVSEWPTSGQDQFETKPYLVRIRGLTSFEVLNGFTKNYLSYWAEKSAPPPPPPTDTTVNGSASAAKTQKQKGKKIVVKATVIADENLTANASGAIKAGKSYKLRPQSKTLSSGQSAALTLKPAKSKDTKKIAKALKKGKKAKAKLSVKLTDGAGNTKTTKLSMKVKR